MVEDGGQPVACFSLSITVENMERYRRMCLQNENKEALGMARPEFYNVPSTVQTTEREFNKWYLVL